MFEALKGQKSHWFRFMDILINGCIKQPDPFKGKVKIITSACHEQAMKFSQVYSNYDHAKYEECFKAQMKDLDKN